MGYVYVQAYVDFIIFPSHDSNVKLDISVTVLSLATSISVIALWFDNVEKKGAVSDIRLSQNKINKTHKNCQKIVHKQAFYNRISFIMHFISYLYH